MDEKRKAGILGNRAVVDELRRRWQDEDGEVRCVSCDSTDITWHHIVPINVGGKDIVKNVAPVCQRCHLAIHTMKPVADRLSANRAKGIFGGRHRVVPENYKELLDDYVFCRIGKKELSARWGLTVTSRKDPTKQIPVDMVHLVDKSWYKDYLRELGIAKVKNHIDFTKDKRNPRKIIKDGEYVGTITYLNGKTVDIYHNQPLEMAQ